MDAKGTLKVLSFVLFKNNQLEMLLLKGIQLMID